MTTKEARTATVTATNVITVLEKFVDQRAGLDFNNYGDIRSYRSEAREITNDRKAFYALLYPMLRCFNNIEESIYNELKATSRRLSINNDGHLEYCAGQYFPTEYRPAAVSLLVTVLWYKLREQHGDSFSRATVQQWVKRNVREKSRYIINNYVR